MVKAVKQQTSLWQNTRFLGSVIAIAAAALVVSGVLLMMLNSPGDFSTVPPITKLTSAGSAPAVATPPPAPVTAPQTSETSETSETSATSTPETSAAEITASRPPRASAPSSPGIPERPTPGQTPRRSSAT